MINANQALSSLLEKSLLHDCLLYECCGQNVFVLYGMNEGISTLSVAYVYRREYDVNENRLKLMGACLSFSLDEIEAAKNVGELGELVQEKIDDGIKHLSEFNGDGGQMPPVRHLASKGAGQ